MGCQVRQSLCCSSLLSGGWDVGLNLDVGGCLVSDEDGSCRLEPLDRRALRTNLPSCAYTGARFLTGPSRMEEASAGL